jgi:CID domain
MALSTSFIGPAKPSASNTSQREPSGKRKRLHLLYLINDVLHHAKFHANDASVASKVQPLLVGLFSSAASFRNSPKHYHKIEELLDIWEDRNYYSTDYIDRLREAVKIARDADQSTEATQSPDRNGHAKNESRPLRNTPFVMPAIHGDQGTPWYDLPAGNLMPHITPNSTRPINPALVKPLRFVAGPADEDLASAVKNLLQEVNNIYGGTKFQDQYENVSWDIDELGQAILHDDVTGEALNDEGYYGWSKTFCEKMKRRRKGLDRARMEGHNERRSRSQSQSQSQSRSRSRSRSRSSSLSSHRYKRRRFSNSDEERSRSRSNSRSRHGRRAYSSSRSPSRDRSFPLQQDKHSRTSHESISRSTSQERNGRDVTGAAHTSRPPSLDAMPDIIREPFGQDIQSMAALQQAFLPQSGHHFSSGVIPIPPPPPPQYGQWPPQPPLPPSTAPYAQQAHPAGSWPPPPPPFLQHWPSASYGQMPPGPPQQGGNGRGAYGGRGRGVAGPSQQHYQGPGSGYNGYRGNGRGNGWS